MTSHTRFCFTSFGELPVPFIDNDMTYLCYQRECCKTTERFHWQGYVEFKSRKRLKTAVKFFREICGKAVHLEIARGSPQQCIDYCKKDETSVEGTFRQFGTISQHKQGKRSDVVDSLEMIKNGKSVIEIIDKHPNQVNLEKRLDSIKLRIDHLKAKKTLRMLHVTYIYGPPGTGKSKLIWEKCSQENYDFYKPTISNDRKIWFDLYSGEQVIWLDDINLNQLDRQYILQLLDIYPLLLPTKGSFVYANYTKVFITSNYSLDDIDAAIKRRIHETIYLE